MISHETVADPRQVTCPECGARQPARGGPCWLCGAEQLGDSEGRAEPSTVAPSDAPTSFTLSTMMLFVTLAAVCFGLLAAAPGLAIPMCVLVVPVLVRTSMVVNRRQAAGHSVTTAQKVGLFVSSFAVASVLSIVVIVAAFCSFCGVCLMAASSSGMNGELAGIGLIVGSIGVAAAVATFYLIKWSRRRYQRDVRG